MKTIDELFDAFELRQAKRTDARSDGQQWIDREVLPGLGEVQRAIRSRGNRACIVRPHGDDGGSASLFLLLCREGDGRMEYFSGNWEWPRWHVLRFSVADKCDMVAVQRGWSPLYTMWPPEIPTEEQRASVTYDGNVIKYDKDFVGGAGVRDLASAWLSTVLGVNR